MNTNSTDDTFRWLPPSPTRDPEPVFGRGVTPTMAHQMWRRWNKRPAKATFEIGAVAVDAWYRRCTISACRVWAGPYLDCYLAVEEGRWHARCAHRLDRRWEYI